MTFETPYDKRIQRVINFSPINKGEIKMTKEILIADYDKGDQEEFQKIFDSTDYKLIFSESGKETIMRMKLFKPDLIIASKNISDRDVFELCRSIKSDPEYKNIPCLLLSNFFEEISENERIDAQADGILSRPLKEDEILNMVDRLIEQTDLLSTTEDKDIKEAGWQSLSDLENVALNELKLDEEEEIIELVDVIEEGEVRLSIDEIVPTQKEELFEKISIQEQLDRIEFEKEVFPKKEERPEDELFEKIELEEILQRVEQLKSEEEKYEEPTKETMGMGETSMFYQEREEELKGFEEFEKALNREVRPESLKEKFEEELSTISLLEPEEFKPEEIKVEEMELKEETLLKDLEEESLEEIPEEELPEEFFEEILKEEDIGAAEEVKEEVYERARIEEEVIPQELRIDKLEEIEAPRIIEETKPLIRTVDKQLEEVILKGVQDMVSDFITKILPEMTQNILNLTMERIEKMVSEIVPNLAEKAIKEEIKRLKEGDKD